MRYNGTFPCGFPIINYLDTQLLIKNDLLDIGRSYDVEFGRDVTRTFPFGTICKCFGRPLHIDVE